MSETPSGPAMARPQFGILSASARAQLLFEDHRRTKLVAYLLWLFLGWFGVHNFYLRRTGLAVVQLILSLIAIGAMIAIPLIDMDMLSNEQLLPLLAIGLVITIPWWLVDMLLIPGRVRRQNELLAAHLGG